MGCAGAEEHLPLASAKGTEDAVRMKFLCSHGGKILPKPDGQLRYVGGDTRLVSFSKTITFADLSCKLEKLFGANLFLKYQLPNEDLDTLISVTCDDDVENLVEEYDKNEARDGASRLRAFLFPKTGVAVRDILPCACHSMEEAKSPRGQKTYDIVNFSQAQATDCHRFSSAMFQMPDYLFGLESANVHVCRQHHQDADNQLSPKRAADDKGFHLKTVRPISPTAAQREFSRQQSSKLIDSGGRGPALTTSALGPLVSNHHQPSWDRRKLWDEGMLVNQRGDDKRQTDVNNDGHHYNQQDVINGVSMVRVSSKDRLVPSFMEVTAVDSLSGFDRQARPQSIPRPDLHSDVLEDGRQDGHFQGNTRLYKPPDTQRVAPEMQWGLPQPAAAVFHAVGADSRRNSGDSDEGSHKGHSGADSVPLVSHPVVITPEGPHGVKVQEAYRHDESILKQQGRHGEYEVSLPQYDGFHHLSKGHFQQVHWQLHDSQEQQQHPISSLELVKVGHGTHGMQRHGQSLEYHSPSAAHHHHMICMASNTRTMPPSDASSVTRLPSPLCKQAASASSPRTDPPSPRWGQVPSGSFFTSRHGVRVLQKHDMVYLPSGKAQQSPGLPSSQVFVNAMEQHGLYDQSGSQAHLTEKGSLANLEPQFFDKIILSNQEGAAGQAHGDDDLQFGCMSNSRELQGVPS